MRRWVLLVAMTMVGSGCASVVLPFVTHLDNGVDKGSSLVSVGQLGNASPGDPFIITTTEGSTIQGAFQRLGPVDTEGGSVVAVALQSEGQLVSIRLAEIQRVEQLARPYSESRALAIGAAIDAVLIGGFAYHLLSSGVFDD